MKRDKKIYFKAIPSPFYISAFPSILHQKFCTLYTHDHRFFTIKINSSEKIAFINGSMYCYITNKIITSNSENQQEHTQKKCHCAVQILTLLNIFRMSHNPVTSIGRSVLTDWRLLCGRKQFWFKLLSPYLPSKHHTIYAYVQQVGDTPDTTTTII